MKTRKNKNKKIKLTINEKKVLKLLIEDARSTDSEIARKLKISPPGVRKIRKKLEIDYIKEYRTIIDYEKIGIEIFAIAHVKILDQEMLKSRNIIGAFEINQSDISHILILGFNNINNLDLFKRKNKEKLIFSQIYTLSKESFLKNSPTNLIKDELK